MINRVDLAPAARKNLRSLPKAIAVRFRFWVDDVESNGLTEARRRPGYHDEPLRGRREGQRSVRLNRAWRVIYVLKADGHLEIVEVQEINKHEY
jgi:proteic killer suppression protein